MSLVFPTLAYCNYQQTLNYCKFTLSAPLSRTQMIALILCVTPGTEFVRGVNLTSYGFLRVSAWRFFTIFIRYGYMIRVKRGIYQVTPEGHALYNAFRVHLESLQSLPFKWR